MLQWAIVKLVEPMLILTMRVNVGHTNFEPMLKI